MPMSSSACKAMVLPEPDRPLTTMSFICPSAHARALSLRELRRRVVPAHGQEMTAHRGLAERGQGAPRRRRQGDAGYDGRAAEHHADIDDPEAADLEKILQSGRTHPFEDTAVEPRHARCGVGDEPVTAGNQFECKFALARAARARQQDPSTHDLHQHPVQGGVLRRGHRIRCHCRYCEWWCTDYRCGAACFKGSAACSVSTADNSLADAARRRRSRISARLNKEASDASTCRWASAASGGTTKAQMMSTGSPSTASKSTPRSSRTNAPVMRFKVLRRPWGMAMP